MRMTQIRLAVTWVVFLGMTGSVQAEPLDLKHVAADAQWLGHVDVDAMRDSIIVQNAYKKHMEKDKGAKARLAFVEQVTGMNPTTDLHGITFYGKELGKHTGVMIAHAKVDQKRMAAAAQAVPGHKSEEHGSHKILSWTHKSPRGERTVATAFHGDEQIVIASSVDQLKEALEVIAGEAPSVANDAPLAGKSPAGTTLLMRVEGVAKADLPVKCRVAKQTEAFRFVTGEHDGKSFYRARAEMTNEDIAQQLQDVVKGARAMGLIHFGDNELGNTLVDALKVNVRGNDLVVLWSAPATDVWKSMEVLAEKMAKHGKRHGKHGRHAHGKHGKRKAEADKRSAEEDF